MPTPEAASHRDGLYGFSFDTPMLAHMCVLACV